MKESEGKMTEELIFLVVELGFGIPGRMLDGSKRDSRVVYNANILIGKKKVWFGDYPKYDRRKLDLLAKICGEDVYLLNEMDCRFETEQNPNLTNAVYVGRAK